MSYDERLAERVRRALGQREVLVERHMFGGLAFMIRGHMCCGVIGDSLVLRLGLEAADAALSEAHTRPMDFTGRPLRSLIYVSSSGLRTSAALDRWINRAIEFVTTLPPR
jgi:hypothetical protein